jgi:cell division protein ZapA
MDSENSGKSQVRLSIYNQTFSLLVPGDPAEIEQAATEVDELMTTIAKSGNMDSTRVAVLACLHLQDRVHTLEREFAEMKSRVDDRTRRLSTLLDSVIEASDPAD